MSRVCRDRAAELVGAFSRIEQTLQDLAGIVNRHITGVYDSFDRFLSMQERTEEQIRRLTEAQERTQEQVRSLAEQATHLAEAQTATDERLNTLIKVAERYFSNGRN